VIAITEGVTPTDYSRGGNFDEMVDAEEFSYGAANRMAKSDSIGQVYTNAAANHQR
jgi:hypothetical protein